jgi:DNA repair protein RecN (Recombination protein N)
MLKQIRISNLALIQDADISFEPGFTAVTGETGAGKSVFLTSLKLCAGERATAQMIRNGEEKALVEAIFAVNHLPAVLAKLESMGIDTDDGEIAIQREILASGKSRARINGALVNISDLSALGDMLIQLHGQSEQVLLRDVRTHVDLLDAYGDHAKALQSYQLAWKDWQRSLQEEGDLRKKASELSQQKEFLQFQSEELTKANLVAGEDAALEARLSESEGQEQKRRYIDQSLDLLDGDEGMLDKLSSLQKAIGSLAAQSKAIAALAPQIEESEIIFRELLRELRGTGKSEGPSAAEIEKINGRMAQFQKLQRKYHTDLSGLIELRDRRRKELSTLENLDDELSLLERRVKEGHKKVLETAKVLHDLRIASALRMDTAVQSQIRELGMAKATFSTAMEPSEPTPSGQDRVEFMMAPNAGEGKKSLRLAVSGGELSRVLLAFKSVLATRDLIPVLVFDEVDSGISGEIAHRIGTCLHELGKSHQVLTITHLHQVASRANAQFSVSKHELESRTHTQITPLHGTTRIQEIARMLGDPKSEAVLLHARKLLEEKHV